MKDFVIEEKKKFGRLCCDVYRKGDEFFVTREQIGRALGYKNPKQSIYDIHKANKERLDKLSTVRKTLTVDGKERETVLYSAKGIYEICRWSKQPKANDFFDFMYEILEGLRLGRLKLKADRSSLEFEQLMFYDIPHQKEQMKKIDSGVKVKSPIKYIKANTIADKAVSKKFGYTKMIKKEDMTTEMLKEREKILEQVTSLMIAQSLGVDIPHIAEVIYKNIDL